MRILPVIDLMNGQVVRGVAGRRKEYRPVKSVLADEPTPGSIGRGLARLGFADVYVADLDAIAGAEPDWDAYRTLIRSGLRPWVDAGLTDTLQAVRLAEFDCDGTALSAIIAGMESLPEPELVARLLELLSPERFIFSLDMKDGRPLTPVAEWQTASPEKIAREVMEFGVRRMIVLDLARVGMGHGIGSEDLCRRLRAADPQLEIISGGGVRGPEDLERLAAAGCNAALVASALHDGRITAGQS